MDKYKLVIFWSEQDERYLVEVPELPGCKADGATRVEAVSMAEEVISEWMETAREMGWTIPEPEDEEHTLSWDPDFSKVTPEEAEQLPMD